MQVIVRAGIAALPRSPPRRAWRRQASAQPAVEQFYKGKSIDVIIGYPPAGSNDTYARALARHIGKHIPGQPNVVPKNMPGAGSFLAVNNVYGVAPKDGTVLAIGAPTIALDERLGTANVRFKTAELGWVGRVDSLINIVFMWHTSKVKTFADAMKYESTLSGTGAGSTVSIYPTVMNNVFGTKFKLIMGYQGLGRGAACGRARRGRGPLDVLDRGEGRPSGLVAEEDDLDPGAVLAHAASGAAGHPDRGRSRAQRRGEAGAERHHGGGRGRLRLLHHAGRAAGAAGRAAARLRRHHEGSGIPGRCRQDQAHGRPDERGGAAEARSPP